MAHRGLTHGYLALATDFDGTIAHDGKVDAQTVRALVRVRERGMRLILVTGRELESLFATFDHTDIFDRVVAENGALIYAPAEQQTHVLAPPPPPELLQALTARGVPFRVGRSVIDTFEPHEHAVLSAIHDLGLEWHIAFNKGAIMVLPSGITKATGLTAVLDELRVPAAQTVGVGDAENDHAFLRMCGYAVAVANALPALKAAAHLVTDGARGAGVIEIIDMMIGH